MPRKYSPTFETRICGYCQEPFSRLDYMMRSHDYKFCSRKCAGRKRVENTVLRVGKRNCLTCGIEFVLWIRPEQKYCSHKCKGPRISETQRGRVMSIESRAKLSASTKGRQSPLRLPATKFICEGCGVEFEILNGRRFLGHRRFCTRLCWYTFIRRNPEAIPWFRGGRDPYYGPNWYHMARLARWRDKDTCQDCGVLQEFPVLDVHHKIPRRAFFGNYELANQLNNLVSLCKTCHGIRESLLTKQGVRFFISRTQT